MKSNKTKDFVMKQAKIPSDKEFKRLLAIISTERHAERNRMAVMLSYLAGLRVGEIASLMLSDVLDSQGQVRDQIRLRPEQTKGNQHRVVFVSKKLQKELDAYLSSIDLDIDVGLSRPLLMTQKRRAFTANTLCQLFGELYRQAGIDGASSHSGRRKFITALAHNSVSPKVIMTLAGHRHLSTTQRYIEVNDAMMRQAVEVI